METEETAMQVVTREHVARGAAWLDTVQPDWVDRVNLETLYMDSPVNCVAGQTLGHLVHEYRDEYENLAYDGYGVACILLARDAEFASEHGFTEYGFNRETHNAWVKLITERRQVVAA